MKHVVDHLPITFTLLAISEMTFISYRLQSAAQKININ